ncbi:peroxiredoxin [Maridesulfovibrio sp.]|uniref:peroxiredoxin n=1 Tax=Maridesulfovibrio sp. TaxID=2795000 RepID=UPI002A18A521|nr:peroxiredoxin [Maridesulfovibrio sp.]
MFAALSILLSAVAQADVSAEQIFDPGKLKPVDSSLKVRVGDMAPDFTLPSINGDKIRLSSFRGRRNVVISFVPAAFTPVCSGQWPGYNIARELFEKNDAVLLGITADNVPSLYAWTRQMGDNGVWFPVLSDFWPHGKTAAKYGVLRAGGIAERAVFIIDKQGIVRYVDVHDINSRPDLGVLVRELGKLK